MMWAATMYGKSILWGNNPSGSTAMYKIIGLGVAMYKTYWEVFGQAGVAMACGRSNN